MPVERSHARLGAFLVVVLILAIATGLLFVQQLRSRAVLDLVTYTTENVSGLDVSSPVRLRGVPVGRVKIIVFVLSGLTHVALNKRQGS